jgi:tetratricopeptide (TPR) repeat protein
MKSRFFLVLLCSALLAGCAGKRGISPPKDIERVITHSVNSGETWESIAVDFYGNPERAEQLALYNGSDPQSALETGAGVRIPLTSRDLRELGDRLDAVAVYNHGLDLAAAGNYARAVEEFQKALEIDPLLSDASFNLAVTYQKLGLHSNAITLLEQLTARYPRIAPYEFALGHSYFHTGEFGAARDAFEAAYEADPEHHKSLFSLAVACEKTGELDRAIDLWQQYLERFPESERAESARFRLGALLDTRGR